MQKYLSLFEKVIVVSLTIMMAIVLFFATVDLGYILIKDVIDSTPFLLSVNELLEVFGLFMLVLIGIELLETMKTYIIENVIRVRVVFMVALIAIARKVIILDVKELPGLTLIGIAAIIAALSVGYYFIRGMQNKVSKHARLEEDDIA
jgi:uncharacterized membrane protein (DUF373 family)